MSKRNAFEDFNPIINFIFFSLAIVFGMIFMHPVFLVISVVLSIGFYVTIAGRDALKLFLMLLPVALGISLLNPLLNTSGETVLFTYFGRNYTLESMLYGVVFAAILVSISFWFAAYSRIITSDKFIYIFGPLAPSLSLVFTMVLRFLPNYGNKAKQISTARQCIGKGGKTDVPQVLGTLTTWSFENGITTYESMRSRGYGSGRRTNFSVYRFTARDAVLTVFILVLAFVVALCAIKGGATENYVPALEFANNVYTVIGATAYALLLLIPIVLNVKEAFTWRILRSKI
ncbi:MAG: energy-coupling factor transporter transmembrane protein EcfT, partial [Clostridia bacterium]|nr:energy-coupling factor transporter transmembrane protein EcfT [Clostridia bacterium]